MRSLAEPAGALEWFYHQHAVVMTPEGTILLFDNGNFRSRPFAMKMPASESYSRAVEYSLDPVKHTVSQIWSYGRPEEDHFFTPQGGSAFWMPLTRNVLVTDGARITDAAGKPMDDLPGARKWARILEVTHTLPARKVFELLVGDPSVAKPVGWAVYRSLRLPSLY